MWECENPAERDRLWKWENEGPLLPDDLSSD
ncbi:hypothetical protein GGU45_002415 [Niabella hirudinis]